MTDSEYYSYTFTIKEIQQLPSFPFTSFLKFLEKHSDIENKANNQIEPSIIRQYLKSKYDTFVAQTIVLSNLKGGVGKTTAAISLATRAAQYGFKTCLLDLDSQASASLAFDKVATENEPIFLDVWQKPENDVTPSLKKINDYFYLLPSALENGLLDAQLSNPSNQKAAVKKVSDVLKNEGFEIIIIDSPPSLGTAVISAVCASDIIIIPIINDIFSMKGVELTLREITSIRETFGLEIPKIKILYNRFDKREKITFDIQKELKEKYPEYLFNNVIRVSTDFTRVLKNNETIFATNRKSKPKEDYDRVLRELVGLT